MSDSFLHFQFSFLSFAFGLFKRVTNVATKAT